jgi:hypothetical protein
MGLGIGSDYMMGFYYRLLLGFIAANLSKKVFIFEYLLAGREFRKVPKNPSPYSNLIFPSIYEAFSLTLGRGSSINFPILGNNILKKLTDFLGQNYSLYMTLSINMIS